MNARGVSSCFIGGFLPLPARGLTNMTSQLIKVVIVLVIVGILLTPLFGIWHWLALGLIFAGGLLSAGR